MLFLIPARAGSKRLPGKNKRLFCGMPLYRWSYVQAVRLCGGDAHMLVDISTDDEEILEEEIDAIQRPGKYCTDAANIEQYIRDYYFNGEDHFDAVCLLQPTSPTRPDSLVRQLIAHGGQVRSVTNGVPNGQCYVYRKGHEGWIDVESEKGHDIDTLEDFEAAERDMMRRFA